jgi:hypothetical protein
MRLTETVLSILGEFSGRRMMANSRADGVHTRSISAAFSSYLTRDHAQHKLNNAEHSRSALPVRNRNKYFSPMLSCPAYVFYSTHVSITHRIQMQDVLVKYTVSVDTPCIAQKTAQFPYSLTICPVV